jgi:hypothetical protein
MTDTFPWTFSYLNPYPTYNMLVTTGTLAVYTLGTLGTNKEFDKHCSSILHCTDVVPIMGSLEVAPTMLKT